ncbi:hypothetical protein T265_11636 [Opisthorchis viverrini]|uniref:Uncharacterized protein n=1 Tax=Opisthorchis viverrini TaxID=6198 RepID=A0A074Z8W4_OPIVI|nr:hypothetical protein T265_11636 [Opisthorchis viverrini]KER19650.1 hypothetical protein T265_11636 [Opisthorchis viverrini]
MRTYATLFIRLCLSGERKPLDENRPDRELGRTARPAILSTTGTLGMKEDSKEPHSNPDTQMGEDIRIGDLQAYDVTAMMTVIAVCLDSK